MKFAKVFLSPFGLFSSTSLISLFFSIGILNFVTSCNSSRQEYPKTLAEFFGDDLSVFTKTQVFRGGNTFLLIGSYHHGVTTLRWHDLSGNTVREHTVKDSITDVISSNDFVLQATHFATGINGVYRVSPKETTVEQRARPETYLSDFQHWIQDGHQFICYQVVSTSSQKAFSVGALCLSIDAHLEKVWSHEVMLPSAVNANWVLKEIAGGNHELVISPDDSVHTGFIVRVSPPFNSLRLLPTYRNKTTSVRDIQWIGTGDFDSDLTDELVGIADYSAITILDSYLQNTVYVRNVGDSVLAANVKCGFLDSDPFMDIIGSLRVQGGKEDLTALLQPALNKVTPIGVSLVKTRKILPFFFMKNRVDEHQYLIYALQKTNEFSILLFNPKTERSQELLSKKGMLSDFNPIGVPQSNYLHLLLSCSDAGKTVVSIESTETIFTGYY